MKKYAALALMALALTGCSSTPQEAPQMQPLMAPSTATAEPTATPEASETATPTPEAESLSAYDRLYAELEPEWESTISLEASMPEIVENACLDVAEGRTVWAVNSTTEERSRFINGIIEEATTYGLCA